MKISGNSPWFLSRISSPPFPRYAILILCALCGSSSIAEDWRNHVRRKEWAEAAILLKAEVNETINPSLEASLELVRAWMYLGRREEALDLLSRLITQAHSPVLVQSLKSKRRTIARQFMTQESAKLHQEGMDLLISNKPKEALAVFTSVLKKEPHQVEVLLRIAQCRFFLQDFETSLETLKTARNLLPDDPEVQTWIGKSHLLLGDLAQAKKELETARGLDPKFDVAILALSDVYIAQGVPQEAIRLLESHLSVQPMDIVALVELAKIRSGGVPRTDGWVRDLPRAKSLLKTALSRSQGWKPETEEEFRFRPWDEATLKKEMDSLMLELDAKGTPVPT